MLIHFHYLANIDILSYLDEINYSSKYKEIMSMYNQNQSDYYLQINKIKINKLFFNTKDKIKSLENEINTLILFVVVFVCCCAILCVLILKK